MRIGVGQDALGRWAWMIVDRRGLLLASGDDYHEAALAMEAAAKQLRLMTTMDRRKRGSGRSTR